MGSALIKPSVACITYGECSSQSSIGESSSQSNNGYEDVPPCVWLCSVGATSACSQRTHDLVFPDCITALNAIVFHPIMSIHRFVIKIDGRNFLKPHCELDLSVKLRPSSFLVSQNLSKVGSDELTRSSSGQRVPAIEQNRHM